ncbi:uncharacterized protein [Macaca nemestrina]|uniref:uncharacterized protein isoform X1 n=1 Tax=Macaca nemestrina TaxID=9545 RepID=UPI0039B8F999
MIKPLKFLGKQGTREGLIPRKLKAKATSSRWDHSEPEQEQTTHKRQCIQRKEMAGCSYVARSTLGQTWGHRDGHGIEGRRSGLESSTALGSERREKAVLNKMLAVSGAGLMPSGLRDIECCFVKSCFLGPLQGSPCWALLQIPCPGRCTSIPSDCWSLLPPTKVKRNLEAEHTSKHLGLRVFTKAFLFDPALADVSSSPAFHSSCPYVYF